MWRKNNGLCQKSSILILSPNSYCVIANGVLPELHPVKGKNINKKYIPRDSSQVCLDAIPSQAKGCETLD
jgi:hypothetical protein